MGRLILFALLCLHLAPVHAGCGALADVSLYDLTERRALPVRSHAGRCYVAAKPGNEYQIVLRNLAAEDLLAVVSVDGINAITGEAASFNQSGYVFASNRSIEIRGWRKSLERVAAFYFTDLGDAYAYRTGRPDNVGIVGAALFRRKPAPSPRAELGLDAQTANAERSAARAAAPSAEGPLGTGHGRPVAAAARYTSFERATEQPAEVIALYYDSQPNLVAQGVIAPVPPRRDPVPFPERFTRDPPLRNW
jgi:hypothetical protein